MSIYYKHNKTNLASGKQVFLVNLGTNVGVWLRRLSGYVFVVFSLLLIMSLVKTATRVINSDKRIEMMRNQVENLEGENRALADSLRRGSSSYAVERDIRDKLGLVKEGESVVVLPSKEILGLDVLGDKAEDYAVSPSNLEKWLELFI